MATSYYRASLISLSAALLLGHLAAAAQGAISLRQPADLSTLRAQFTPEPPRPSRSSSSPVISTGTRLFVPPDDTNPASGPFISTGTRQGGCLGSIATAFTALGPLTINDQVVGQTVSTRPTFVWHLPEIDESFPVIFRLLAPNEDDIPAPIHEVTLEYTSGFVAYQLPVTMDALSTDVQYRWQVLIECNPEFPAQAMLQELSFEVVPATPSLAQALASAATDTERATAYGQAGIWYDAIAQVAAAATPADRATRATLLQDLAASMPENRESLQQDILEIAEISQ